VEVGYVADVAHELAAWVKPILHKKCTPTGKLKQCLINCNRGGAYLKMFTHLS